MYTPSGITSTHKQYDNHTLTPSLWGFCRGVFLPVVIAYTLTYRIRLHTILGHQLLYLFVLVLFRVSFNFFGDGFRNKLWLCYFFSGGTVNIGVSEQRVVKNI